MRPILLASVLLLTACGDRPPRVTSDQLNSYQHATVVMATDDSTRQQVEQLLTKVGFDVVAGDTPFLKDSGDDALGTVAVSCTWMKSFTGIEVHLRLADYDTGRTLFEDEDSGSEPRLEASRAAALEGLGAELKQLYPGYSADAFALRKRQLAAR